MNQYEVMVGNLSFYINANGPMEALEQLELILARLHGGATAVINGDVLVDRYLAESIPKSLLQ